MPHGSEETRKACNPMLTFARITLVMSATTLYEGGLEAALKMGGLQKLTYVRGLEPEFTAIAGKGIDPERHVHPALFATLPAAVPGSSSSSGKSK